MNFMNFYTFNKPWPYRLIVRTQASQAWNSGAIPGKVTIVAHINFCTQGVQYPSGH